MRTERDRGTPGGVVRQEKPYPTRVDVNPDNAGAVLAAGGTTAEQRNAALHEATQAAARRTQLTRVERRITELISIIARLPKADTKGLDRQLDDLRRIQVELQNHQYP